MRILSIIGTLLLAGFLAPTASFIFSSSSNHGQLLSGTRQRRRRQDRSSPPLRMILESPILTDFGAGYSALLQNHYYPTQSATGGIFSLLGDAVAQVIERNSEKLFEGEEDQGSYYDSKRGATYFAKGLGGGIMWSYWFGMVDPLATQLTNALLMGQSTPTAERAARTTVSILLEQFLVCPIFYSFWDIPMPALMRGSPPRQIPRQIEEKLPPLLIANAKVWTPVNLVTYNIPIEYRVLFTSFADILWQSINASITSKEINVMDVATGAMETTEPESVAVAFANRKASPVE